MSPDLCSAIKTQRAPSASKPPACADAFTITFSTENSDYTQYMAVAAIERIRGLASLLVEDGASIVRWLLLNRYVSSIVGMIRRRDLAWFRGRNVVLLLFLIAVAARVFTMAMLPSLFPTDVNRLASDSKEYDQSAIDGLRHGSFSTYWPPGLPLYLAAFYAIFGHSIIFPLAGLVVLGSLISVVTYFLAMLLFRIRGVAILAGLIVSIEPALVWESPMILSDTLALFLFSVFMYYCVKDIGEPRIHHLVFLGLILGALILVRPMYAGLSVIYILTLLIRFLHRTNLNAKGILLRLVLLLAVAGLVILPWLVYTTDKLGVPAISTNGGNNFYIGNNPNSSGRYSLTQLPDTGNSVENQNEAYHNGIQFVASNPGRALVLDMKKLLFSVLIPQRTPLETDQRLNAVEGWSFAMTMNATFTLTELLGVFGFYVSRRSKSIRQNAIGLFLLYFYVVQIVYFVDRRFSLPLIFLYSIFGSWFVWYSLVSSNRNLENPNFRHRGTPRI